MMVHDDASIDPAQKLKTPWPQYVADMTCWIPHTTACIGMFTKLYGGHITVYKP